MTRFALAVALLPLSLACSGEEATTPDAGSAPTPDGGPARDASSDAVDASGGSTGCPGADALPTAEEMLVTTNENTTQVDVIFLTPTGEGRPDELTFRIVMTNHTCSVPGYEEDLDGKVVVETADGVSIDAGYTSEILSTDSHHPVALLTMPSTVDGVPIIGCDTEWLRLTLQGIDGGDRVYEWDQTLILPAAQP